MFCCIALVLVGCMPQSRPLNWSAESAGQVRTLVRNVGGQWYMVVDGQHIAAAHWLEPFYRRRAYRPAWMAPGGVLARVDVLLEALRQVEKDGLDPQEYRLAQIIKWVERLRSATATKVQMATADLLLTNAFLQYAAHLQRGRVRAQEIHEEWRAKSPRTNLAGLLQTGLDLGHVGEVLDGLRPPQPGYALLRQAVAAYRDIAAQGGWPRLEEDASALTKWAPAEKGKLRRRLYLVGDVEKEAAGDAELRRGLQKFQNRHGLEPTGHVDEATLAALNTPVQQRLAQIILNMERWRWLPHDPGTRYILVRLADFELDVVEAGQVVLNMRVIVGREYWRTPIFSCALTHLVVNPYWYVPESIARAEILPLVRRAPDYLQRKGFRIVEGTGESARTIGVEEIEWAQLDQEPLPLRLIQAPGPENPLGKVKFALPNPFGIYLHDTPNSQLFERRERYLSHGCIRLEQSVELAEYLLRQQAGWTGNNVRGAVQEGRTVQVDLVNPIAVYLIYWTAWVDEDGAVQFREDLYGEDDILRQALGQ